MTDWKSKINSSTPSTASLYGGLTVDNILNYFSAVDLSAAGVDTTGIADIATYTYFYNNAFNIWDSDKSHSVKFQTPNYTSNKTIIFPSESAIPTADELVLKDAVQIITNKTISASSNTISNLPNQSGVATSGTHTANGGGTTFTIAHSAGSTPDFVSIEANSDDARDGGDFKVALDATNITITYGSATNSGTNNISLLWSVGFINFSSYVLTPDSLTTFTQKTIGDGLTFDTISTPSNPSSGQIILYPKTIDGNNVGIFAKIEKNGGFVELQIA